MSNAKKKDDHYVDETEEGTVGTDEMRKRDDDKTIVSQGTDTLKIKLQKAAQSPAALVLLTGPSRQVGKQWQLLKSHMVVGRAMEAEIFIDDKGVSRKHAQIIIGDNQIFIEDLGSANGTSINGEKLAPQIPRLLKDNEQIKAGTVILKFLERGNVEAISNQELYDQNQLDPLTQINNKRALVSTGQELFRRAKITEVPLTVIVFDLDHFRNINNTHGHLAGDFVLRELARVIKDDMIRKEDFFARFGGEEFCLILFGSDLKLGNDVAERIRGTIERHKFVWQNTPIPVTVSMGVASQELTMDSWEELFDAADKALYKSKQAGRNRVTSA